MPDCPVHGGYAGLVCGPCRGRALLDGLRAGPFVMPRHIATVLDVGEALCTFAVAVHASGCLHDAEAEAISNLMVRWADAAANARKEERRLSPQGAAVQIFDDVYHVLCTEQSPCGTTCPKGAPRHGGTTTEETKP